jgi:iron complex transport system substrate-binding protein
MPELIALGGGQAVGVAAGAPAPTVTADDIAALRPEIVVVKPCGFTLPRALAERHLIARALAPLAAAGPRPRVYVTDGSAYFNRPGPRLVESLEIMAACVHPELFADLGARHAADLRLLD